MFSLGFYKLDSRNPTLGKVGFQTAIVFQLVEVGFLYSQHEFSFASKKHLKNIKFRFVYHRDIMSVMDKSRLALEISSQDLFVKAQRIEEV